MNDWLIPYVGGIIVALVTWILGKPAVAGTTPATQRLQFALNTLTVLLWPLMLPLSFLALLGTLCYYGLMTI